jgi:heterodisulfide reductase subunit A
MDPSIAQVDIGLCAGCGQCVTACPYDAIVLEDGHADVKGFICKGCGTCAAACPNKAMNLIHYSNLQLVSEMIGALQADVYAPPVISLDIEVRHGS